MRMRVAWARAAASRLWQRDGQDLLEYGLLAALIALVVVGAVTSAGRAIYDVFWSSIANNF
jgi:Flp pilus assembly pilin Flp